jgi:hypothetical protein
MSSKCPEYYKIQARKWELCQVLVNYVRAVRMRVVNYQLLSIISIYKTNQLLFNQVRCQQTLTLTGLYPSICTWTCG